METYRAYLALLGELSNILEKLSEKAQEKTKAVCTSQYSKGGAGSLPLSAQL